MLKHLRSARYFCTVLLAGCASLPPPIPDDPGLAACRARYLALDRRTDAAGVRDAGARSVEGFPYLRVNRFLASFREEVKDGAPFADWMERMRELDLEARGLELRNLGEPVPLFVMQELDRCGQAWAAHDRRDAQRGARLRENAVVPDDYSTMQRVLGLYPLAAPFIKRGVLGTQEEVRQDYARPLASLESPGPLVLWKAEEGKALPRRQVARWLGKKDRLGIPRLDEAQWRQLAAAHAPRWWIETGGGYDHPGAPWLGESAPGLDSGNPVTYFLPGYTRFRGKVLPQITYVVWFSERPSDGLVDSYAGTLDGVTWRVTLAADGAPLLFDTIHPCGCYHQLYAYKRLNREPAPGFWTEPLLMPQPAMPAQPFAIRVQSATHYVRRLVPLASAKATETRRYALVHYRELLSLPTLTGVSRSLFDDEGLVAGTGRMERFWLWPAGIASAGAMRQAGRQATAFVGRRHFDDPDLLERAFAAEPPKKQKAQKASKRKRSQRSTAKTKRR